MTIPWQSNWSLEIQDDLKGTNEPFLGSVVDEPRRLYAAFVDLIILRNMTQNGFEPQFTQLSRLLFWSGMDRDCVGPLPMCGLREASRLHGGTGWITVLFGTITVNVHPPEHWKWKVAHRYRKYPRSSTLAVKPMNKFFVAVSKSVLVVPILQ